MKFAYLACVCVTRILPQRVRFYKGALSSADRPIVFARVINLTAAAAINAIQSDRSRRTIDERFFHWIMSSSMFRWDLTRK